MALQAAVGSFIVPNSLGADLVVSGPGFQPAIVFFLPTNRLGDGGAASNFADGSFGVATSSTSMYCIANISDDGVATSVTRRFHSSGLCSAVISTSSVSYSLDFLSMDATGFTVNVANTGVNQLVGYLALNDTAGVNVKTGSFLTATSTGNQNITGIGFKPDTIVLFSVNSTDSPSTTALRNHASFTLGFGSPTQRGVMAYVDEDDQGTTDSSRYQSKSSIYAALNLQSGTLEHEADITSLDNDGFTLNWSTNNGSAYYAFYAAMGGGLKINVGSLLSQTGAGNFSVTGAGFEPQAGMFLSFGSVANVSPIPTVELSLGVAVSSSQRFAHGGNSKDNVGTSATTNMGRDIRLYANYLEGTAILEGDIDFVSWDSSGFTLNQTDADIDNIEILYMVLGSITPPPPATTTVVSIMQPMGYWGPI